MTYAAGVVGQAFQLDGTSGAVVVPDTAALRAAEFTVGGWFNLAEAPAANSEFILASKYDGNDHGSIFGSAAI